MGEVNEFCMIYIKGYVTRILGHGGRYVFTYRVIHVCSVGVQSLLIISDSLDFF